jgi:hypothetical protein
MEDGSGENGVVGSSHPGRILAVCSRTGQTTAIGHAETQNGSVRIRLMSGRALRITARIAFLLCGLISLVTSAPYVLQRGEDLPIQGEWVLFAVALALVGVFSMIPAVLPRSWIAKACKKGRDDEQLFSTPLRLLGAFAAIAYLLALVAYLAPHSWNLNPQLMLALCPMYFVKMSIDPSPIAIFFLLAPMNAAVYGALGATVGYDLLAFRNRH